MRSMNTKALVEGAIFAAVTAVLGILVYYMPLLSLVGMFWSTPIIIIGFRNGFKVSFISAVVAGIIVSIFTEPFSGLYLFIVFGISGIVMGYLMNKKISPPLNIAISGLVLAVCSVFGILFGFFIAGQSTAQVVEQMMKVFSESIDSAVSLYRAIGISEDQLSSTAAIMKESISIMQYIIPTLFLINGMVFSFINYKVVRMILGRMKYQIENVKPFSQWRLPDNFSFGMFIIIILTLIASYLKIPNMQTVEINILYTIRWVFTIIGLSVASFTMDKYKVNRPLKIVILFFFFMRLSNFLTIAGVVDTVFNLRKLNKKHIGGI